MSGDVARWLAAETAATLTHDTPACPACPVCRDTGVVECVELDGEGAYDTACTEPGCTTPFPVAADFTDTGEAPY